MRDAKHLSDTICDSSPVLLYTQGKIYEAQKDNIKALLFFQKASEATYRFAVAPDTAQKIWYARYESEYPNRTQASIDETNNNLKDKTQRLQELEDELNKMKIRNAITDGSDLNKEKSNAKTWLWTGVGIDIAGLALIGTGAALVFTNLDKPVEMTLDNNVLSQPVYKTKPRYIAGWGMLTAGIAFTVVGTILAGYFGYQYTHVDQNLETAFSLSPTGASFSLKF